MPALRTRADVQGLRAVAVLLVVLAHAGVPGLSGGYVGVDVFFVLSGFLITAILLHEATADGDVSLIGFYAKRARRILPAATVTLVATAAVATVLLPSVHADQLLEDVLWAALFGANIHVASQSTDYFAADAPVSAVQHFWSLAVEEQFYVVWPVLLALVLVAGVRRDHRAVRRRLPRLRRVLLVLVAASFAWSLVSTAATPDSAYFSTLARGWELGVGALLALAGRGLPLLTLRARRLLSVGGLAMVLLAALTFTERTPVPGYSIALPVVGTAALLAAGAGAGGDRLPWISRMLGRQPLRWVGDVSYGFYLWHWPFLVIPAAYLGRPLGLLANLLLVAAALLVAWGSLHLIENPVRQARPLLTSRRRALLLWPVAVLCVLAVNTGAHAYFDAKETAAARRSAAVDVGDLAAELRAPRIGNDVHDAVAAAVDRIALDAPPVSPLAQDLTEVRFDRNDRPSSCSAGETDTQHELCVAGDTDADRTMVVIGDSHAQMWLTPIDAIAARSGYRLVPLIKLGCSPYDLTEWHFDRGEPFEECTQYQEWVDGQLAELDPEVILAAGATSLRTVDASTGTLLSTQESASVVRAGVASAVSAWRESADTVRLLGDVPRLPFAAADCLSDPQNTAADCSFEVPDDTLRSNALVRSGTDGQDAGYLDVLDMFCLDGTCPTVVEDMVVYFDNDHITDTYAAWLTEELGRRLALPE
jgi:peptidoglycan/LPS O-acetylase OafA/YrhL